jgi:hypothetical protein
MIIINLKQTKMKKNLLKTLARVFITVLLFSGCKKETEQLPVVTDVQDEQVAKHDDDDNKCQLRRVDFGNNQFYEFHYNRKGLADKWHIDYGGGDFIDYQMMYNNRGRIINTQLTQTFPGNVNYKFYYTGNFITHVTGHDEASGELVADIYFKYNRTGQMVKWDDIAADTHSRYFYNNRGFNTRTDFFIGPDLILESHHKYVIPNRNPYLAVKGVEFGFPFPDWQPVNKRLLSQDSVILYDEGEPFLINDYDPAKTRIQTGIHNYVTHAYYFDRASFIHRNRNIIFTYQKCGDNDDDFDKPIVPSPAKEVGPLSPVDRLNKILSSTSKNKKQELKAFRKQYSEHR